MDLLHAMLVFVDTASWVPNKRHSVSVEQASDCMIDDEDNKGDIKDAPELISSIFREPLESKSACLASLFDEIDEIVHYARKYLDLLEDYRKPWFKLHSVPEAKDWPNVLLLCQLLFSLPFTNSAVERAFSKLKVLKADRRNRLFIDSLDDLQVNIEGQCPENFSANDAVRLWNEDRSRRPHQEPRKQYWPRSSLVSETEEGSSVPDEERTVEEFTLDDWDRLFHKDEPRLGSEDSD